MRFFLVLVLVVMSGCSRDMISMNVDSDGSRTPFEPSKESEKTAYIPPPDSENTRGRAPFINLSSYDWDYHQWLQAISDMSADLRLPAVADTFIEIRVFAGQDAAPPEAKVICTAGPEVCLRLEDQAKRFSNLPPLPAGFPDKELVVKLSRLP